MKKITLLLLLSLFVSCSHKKAVDSSDSYSDSPQQQKSSSPFSVEEISKLKPQIHPPIKIAINFNMHDVTSPEETKEIESWLPALKELGFANELIILPKSAYDNSYGSNINAARAVAASLHADAVIVIDGNSRSEAYVNPLSIFNITIIGMWVIPGHNKDVHTVLDASIFDTNSGYLYGFARGQGTAEKMLPFMYTNYRTGVPEAKMVALQDLGKQLIEQVKLIMKNKKYKP